MRWPAFAVAAALAVATTASAQRTLGTSLPTASFAESDGANALLDNIAGLSTLGGWEARVYNVQRDGAPGEGTAALFGMPLFGVTALGLGLEVLRPEGQSTSTRLSLGGAFKLHESVRVGLNTRFYFSDHDAAVEGGFSLDAGLLLRPLAWLSFGLSAQSLDTPDLGAGPEPRRYGLGLAFHPGTDRVSLELGASVTEDTGNTDAIARLSFAPIAGLEIGARFVASPRGDDFGWELGTSLAFQFGMGGMEGGAFAGAPLAGAAEYQGFVVGARVSGAAYPNIAPREDRTVVVDVGGLPEQPSTGLLGLRQASFTQLAMHLLRLADDPTVTGVILRDRGSQPGWAQAEELSEAIRHLRERGKDVTAYLDQGDLRHVFQYAGANRIVMNPAGGLIFIGLKSVLTFYKEVLDKLRISVQFVQFEEYKSFPEQFTRTGPSPAAQEARLRVLDGLYGAITRTIDEGRRFESGQTARLIDGGPYVAAECLENKLIDSVAFYDELPDVIRQATGRRVSLLPAGYAQTPGREPWARPPAIAVIPVEGTIVDGTSSRSPFFGSVNVGGETIVGAVNAAAGDPEIAAIVVRVDSPGGSSLASDKMYRALERAARKKPVIASFGDTAASGGYYLAMGATEVFASNATITGSIGIFTGKPIFGPVLGLLGIGRDTLVRGKRADLFETDRAWNAEELAVIRQKLDALYRLFLDRVAKNRKLDDAAVREVARGRVWLGVDAKERKLVDSVGGVVAAIARAKTLAGLSADARVTLRFYPEASLVERLRASLGVEVEALLALVPGAARALEDASPFLTGTFAPGEPLLMAPYRLSVE